MPSHHDLVLAITSHLPHLIAYNIVGTAHDLEKVTEGEVIKYSAGGFRDFTRIAASDPTMWRDVFLNNREAVLEVLGRFNEDLSAAAARDALRRRPDSCSICSPAPAPSAARSSISVRTPPRRISDATILKAKAADVSRIVQTAAPDEARLQIGRRRLTCGESVALRLERTGPVDRSRRLRMPCQRHDRSPSSTSWPVQQPRE